VDLSGAVLSQLRGAYRARNLETTVIPRRRERYFEECERRWPERYMSWETIQTVGKLKLFAVSYSVLAFLLTSFYIVGLYNEKVELARAWAEQAVRSEDRSTRLLAAEISERVDLVLFDWQVVLLFAATIVLVLASIIYAFGCPAEVKDFTRSQWCHQLNRSLVVYWGLAWQARTWRIICAVFYAVGGTGVFLILGWKLLRALYYVARYGNIWPLGS
jgi:hypothetical protein